MLQLCLLSCHTKLSLEFMPRTVVLVHRYIFYPVVPVAQVELGSRSRTPRCILTALRRGHELIRASVAQWFVFPFSLCVQVPSRMSYEIFAHGRKPKNLQSQCSQTIRGRNLHCIGMFSSIYLVVLRIRAATAFCKFSLSTPFPVRTPISLPTAQLCVWWSCLSSKYLILLQVRVSDAWLIFLLDHSRQLRRFRPSLLLRSRLKFVAAPSRTTVRACLSRGPVPKLFFRHLETDRALSCRRRRSLLSCSTSSCPVLAPPSVSCSCMSPGIPFLQPLVVATALDLLLSQGRGSGNTDYTLLHVYRTPLHPTFYIRSHVLSLELMCPPLQLPSMFPSTPHPRKRFRTSTHPASVRSASRLGVQGRRLSQAFSSPSTRPCSENASRSRTRRISSSTHPNECRLQAGHPSRLTAPSDSSKGYIYPREEEERKAGTSARTPAAPAPAAFDRRSKLESERNVLTAKTSFHGAVRSRTSATADALARNSTGSSVGSSLTHSGAYMLSGSPWYLPSSAVLETGASSAPWPRPRDRSAPAAVVVRWRTNVSSSTKKLPSLGAYCDRFRQHTAD